MYLQGEGGQSGVKWPKGGITVTEIWNEQSLGVHASVHDGRSGYTVLASHVSLSLTWMRKAACWKKSMQSLFIK